MAALYEEEVGIYHIEIDEYHRDDGVIAQAWINKGDQTISANAASWEGEFEDGSPVPQKVIDKALELEEHYQKQVDKAHGQSW